MRNQTTINEIESEFEALYRNVTGRGSLSAIEFDTVRASIIDAMQMVTLEYGIEPFRFHRIAQTTETTANQSYVDLLDHTYRVVSGTVRITSSDTFLSMIDEKAIFISDPDLSETGTPEFYAYGTNESNPDSLRLSLWPIPDNSYTLSLDTLRYPEEDLDSFPAALGFAIKLKAKSLSCSSLGLSANANNFEAHYSEVINKIKDGYSTETPKHVGRRIAIHRDRFGERRLS